MSNYTESKKALDKIRDEYGCKGDLLFRTAINCVVEYGTSSLVDDWDYEHLKQDINEYHDEAEAEGKNLVITRRWELATLECAREIAHIDICDLLVYIQKEIFLGRDGGIDYQRAVELLKQCMYDIEQRENCENKLTLYAFEDIGFDDEELRELGFGYLATDREEEDE